MNTLSDYPIEIYSPERIREAFLIIHPKILEKYKITREEFYGVFERGSNFSQLKYPLEDDFWNIFHDSEWYYMAQRFSDLDIKKNIAEASKSKWKSKNEAYKYKDFMNSNEEDRIKFMRESIEKKYDQSSWRQDMLRETQEREIIEFTYWWDEFFWISNTLRRWRNILGKLHMEYRSKKL